MRALLLSLAITIAALAAAPAQAAPIIGIGEQKPAMFSDPLLHEAEPPARALHRAVGRAARRAAAREARHWMEHARADEHARAARRSSARCARRKLARTLPTDVQFAREFKRFRKRYPYVRDWLVWNEANHPFSLTANRPRKAARYFGIVARNCRGCNVVAARRARRARDDGVGEALPALRAGDAADLGHPQLRRHEPAASRPAPGRCCGSRRARSGSPRPAGSSCGASTRARR